jgi:hypothetical protein
VIPHAVALVGQEEEQERQRKQSSARPCRVHLVLSSTSANTLGALPSSRQSRGGGSGVSGGHIHTHTHTHTHVHHVETYGCRSKGLSLVVHAVTSALAILSYEYIQAFAWTCRKRRHFLSFFLCLSRACLGKMIGFSIEWLKSGVFRTLMVHRL